MHEKNLKRSAYSSVSNKISAESNQSTISSSNLGIHENRPTHNYFLRQNQKNKTFNEYRKQNKLQTEQAIKHKGETKLEQNGTPFKWIKLRSSITMISKKFR